MNHLTKDTQVKVYFKTGAVVEGIVLEWSEREAVLRALTGNNKLVIYRPNLNVMMVKICTEHPSQTSLPDHQYGADLPSTDGQLSNPGITDIGIDVSEVDVEPLSTKKIDNTMTNRTKRLVELRTTQSTVARAQVSQTLRRQAPVQVSGAKYELPNFTKRRVVVGSSSKDH